MHEHSLMIKAFTVTCIVHVDRNCNLYHYSLCNLYLLRTFLLKEKLNSLRLDGHTVFWTVNQWPRI